MQHIGTHQRTVEVDTKGDRSHSAIHKCPFLTEDIR